MSLHVHVFAYPDQMLSRLDSSCLHVTFNSASLKNRLLFVLFNLRADNGTCCITDLGRVISSIPRSSCCNGGGVVCGGHYFLAPGLIVKTCIGLYRTPENVFVTVCHETKLAFVVRFFYLIPFYLELTALTLPPAEAGLVRNR
uniref:Peptidyl-tRNA hydrolase ICT1 n=1 Tax=Schistocephalus solidus TaxID=70667 RepID=A0A0X3PXK5_SCHSO